MQYNPSDLAWLHAIERMGKRFEDDPRAIKHDAGPSPLPTYPYPLLTRIGTGGEQCAP